MWSVLLVAYSLMAMAQTQGGAIIEWLHGAEASHRALSQLASDTVQPTLSYQQLCVGYSAAHFDSSANILHAMGMISTMWLFIYATTLWKLGFGSIQHFFYIPPLYYLPAWLGHFWWQKDIPAVFTYGTSLTGWRNGELCAWEDLFRGGTITNLNEFLYTMGVTAVVLSMLMAFGGLFPQDPPSVLVPAAAPIAAHPVAAASKAPQQRESDAAPIQGTKVPVKGGKKQD